MHPNFPPRGGGTGRPETLPMAGWVHPEQLSPKWDWTPGKILLGRTGSRLIGFDDDRHVVTFAGTGAGKTSTVLKHNVAAWPGSIVVLDPKGELAKTTAARRRAAGHRVFIFDPFGITGEPSASYNPFGELGFGSEKDVPADAALSAEAMILQSGNDSHWSDAGRNFIRGLLLHYRSKGGLTLRVFREIVNAPRARLEALLEEMVASDAYDGIVANIGGAFLAKMEESPREFASILSAVQEQTVTLDDMVGISDHSDFDMADLKNGNITIYLVLPGLRMGTHFRWLRLMVQMALGALERHPVPRGETPVLFLLEEFATLGHMRSIETAAGLMRGMGVKLWTVLQDMTQLQQHYQKSWETFLGNAGVIQCFGLQDLTTTEHLSKMLGMTQVLEHQDVRVSSAAMAQGDTGRREQLRSVRLLEADEIRIHFARETNRQFLIVPGRPPIFLDRMEHYE